MFNINLTKQKLLQKQSIAILSILIGGSLLSIAYATSTIVSDSGIITPSLTVNGNQIGEGSFTSYNTVQLNTTVIGFRDTLIGELHIGNDGAVILHGDSNNKLVYINGTQVFEQTSHTTPGSSQETDQSLSGEYKIVLDTSTSTVQVYKNNNYLQALGFNSGQFTALHIGTAISPDGHYIVIMGEDSGGAIDRIVIFKGT